MFYWYFSDIFLFFSDISYIVGYFLLTTLKYLTYIFLVFDRFMPDILIIFLLDIFDIFLNLFMYKSFL